MSSSSGIVPDIPDPGYMDEEELTGPAAELTEDDKLYLKLLLI